MSTRTTSADVAAAVKTQPSVDIEPHIRTASRVVDHLVANDSSGVLSDELQYEIETYLAAHFYALLDPQFRQESRGKASASFILGKEGEGFKATPWGQQAIALDVSGQLGAMSSGKTKLKVTWLGTPQREARDYWTR